MHAADCTKNNDSVDDDEHDSDLNKSQICGNIVRESALEASDCEHFESHKGRIIVKLIDSNDELVFPGLEDVIVIFVPFGIEVSNTRVLDKECVGHNRSGFDVILTGLEILSDGLWGSGSNEIAESHDVKGDLATTRVDLLKKFLIVGVGIQIVLLLG